MKRILLPLFVIAATGVAHADDDIRDKFNPVHTAVISQTIASDARAAALGDVGAATDPDVNSQSWNPAKYPFTVSRAGVSLNYTPWLRQLTEGIALVNAVGYSRLGDYQALSGSIKYFTVGEVPLQNNSGSIRSVSRLPLPCATCIPISPATIPTKSRRGPHSPPTSPCIGTTM